MASLYSRLKFVCVLFLWIVVSPAIAGTVWVDSNGNYYIEVPATLVSLSDEFSPVLRANDDYPYIRLIRDGDSFRSEKLSRAGFENIQAALQEIGRRFRGDFDGDGRPDLLLQTRDGHDLLITDVSTVPVIRPYTIGRRIAEHVTLQDVNQDGRLDLVDQNDGTVLYAQSDGFSVAYEQGDYVGSLAGGHQVTPSGEFTYSMPITVAPATGQFQPDISLHYSSAGPNGHLGVGWSIGGLRSIVRCEQNLELNGALRRVDFTSTDRFCLDGQQLLVRNGQTYGANNAEYRTVQSNFERIVSKTASGVSGPVGFEVTDTTGNTFYFGRQGSNNDALILTSNNQAFVWALKRVEDASGNFYTFHYQKNPQSLEFYLTHVNYTGNGSRTPTNEVRFIYDSNRVDQLVSYVAGQPITTTQRLARIESRANNNLLRTYHLTYQNVVAMGPNAPSRLQNIRACDSANLCLSPTQFIWNQRDYNGFSREVSGTISRDSRYKGHQMWDYNGDGLPDIAYVRNNRGSSSDHLYLIENTGSNLVERWQMSGEANKSFRNTWKIVDLDKDGRDEIIYRNSDGYWYQIRHNGSGFTRGRVAGIPRTSSDAYTHVVDMDGDGLPELIHTVNNRLSVQRGTRTGFASTAETVQVNLNSPGPNYTVSLVPFDREDNTMPATDFTGDGRSDFIMQVRQTYFDPNPPPRPCYEPPCAIEPRLMSSQQLALEEIPHDLEPLIPVHADELYPVEHYVESESDTSPIGQETLQITNASSSIVYWKILVSANRTTLNEYLTIGSTSHIDQVMPVDINGDGLADIVYRQRSDKRWFVRINNGRGFNTAIPVAVIDQTHLKFVDLYGDGRLQILNKVGNRYDVYHLNNNQFVRRTFFNDSGSDYWNGNLVDMSGNGTPDFLRFSGRYYIKYRRDTGRDRIVQVVDGFNERLTIGYSTLAVPGVHTRRTDGPSRNWGNNSLVRDIKGAVPVVRTIQNSADRLTYEYTGGKMQVGRGMLGYEQVRITSQNSGLRTTTHYRQDGDFRGSVSRVQVEVRIPPVSPPTPPGPVDPCLRDPRLCMPDPCFDERVCQPIRLSPFMGASNTIQSSGGSWRLQSDTQTEYTLRANSLFSTNSNKTQVRFVYPTLSTTRRYNTDSGQQQLISTQTQRINGIDLFGQPLEVVERVVDPYSTVTTTTTNTYTLPTHFGGRLTGKNVRKERRHHYGSQSQPGAITLTNSFAYDSRGRLISTTSDSGIQTQYQLNAFGLITRETMSVPNMTSRSSNRVYDSSGRYLTSETNALNQTTSYNYTNRGLLNYTQYANGQRVYYDYSGLGRLIRSTTTPANNTSKTGSAVMVSSQTQYWCTTSTTICPTGAVYYIEYIAPGVAPRRSYLDKVGRELRNITRGFDGRWVYVDTAYDSRGRVVSETVPHHLSNNNPGRTRYQYDEQGRVIELTRADGSVWRTEYNGLSTINISPGNRRTIETHNSLGDLVQVEDAIGTTASYFYDANGNSTILAGPGGNVVVRYDKWGNKTRITDPDAGITNYTYNAYHELIRQRDARGQVIDYTYDVLGRQIRMVRKTPDGVTEHDIHTQYDSGAYAIGQISSVEDKRTSHRVTYAYDTFARKRQETIRFDGNTTYTQQWAFDAHGRLRTETDATGGGVTYNYNSNHWLTSIDDKDIRSGSSALRYWRATAADALGNITDDQLGARINRTRVYDDRTGLLTHIETTATSQPKLQHWQYQWDELGNLTQRRDETLGNRENFTYDALNRVITSRVHTPSGNSSSGNANITYDAFGNILTKTGVGTYIYGSTRPHAVTQITGTRANTFQYDANGNMTRDNQRQLIYNTWNKPIDIIRSGYKVAFRYDPFGNVSQRSETGGVATSGHIRETRYVGNVEFIRVDNGAWEQRRYVGGVAVVTKLATQNASQSQIRYLLTDHLGSTHVITNANGVSEELMSFDAFGARRNATQWTRLHQQANIGTLGSVLTNRGFTGHQQVDDVGLIHMGGRVYDPVLGRFLQADPFIQQPNNIQNFNRYSYVLNNPLNATDPSGYFFQMLVIWAANYLAASATVGSIGAALGYALTAYSYYGYAQMAVGAIQAIDGGGTAMANFAGGMAKGFAKSYVFGKVMGDATELGAVHAAQRDGGSTAPKGVVSESGASDTDGHTRSGKSGRYLDESERGAVTNSLDSLNENVNQLGVFKTHQEAAEWLHDNAFGLSEHHGVELYARIYEHADGFSVGTVTTSYHTSRVGVADMNNSVSTRVSTFGRAADWHSHPATGASNFSQGDYSKDINRYVSFREYWREPGLRHFDGRRAWSDFGYNAGSPAAPRMTIEFGDKYSVCIKGGC